MAAAVEAAPEAGLGSAGLIAYGLGFTALALAVAWNYTIGAGLRSIAAEIAKVRLPRIVGGGRVFGVVADQFYAVDREIHGALVAVANANLHAGRWLFNETARAWDWTIHALAHLAVATDRAVEHFGSVTLPRWERHALSHTGSFATWLLRESVHLQRGFHDFLRHELHRVSVTAQHTAVALPREIARVRTRVGRLEKEATREAGRVSKLEKVLGIASVTALVAAALSRLGLKWLRCGNVGRAGRSVCRMDSSLLTKLLGDVAAILGVLSLVEFIEDGQKIEREAVSALHLFIRTPSPDAPAK